MVKQLALLLTGVLFLAGCGGGSSGGGGGGGIAIVPESSVCTSSLSYSPSITLTSSALYQARQVTTSGLVGPLAAQAIRFAEVIVQDSAGNQIQCGVTDASGNLVATDLTSPLVLPKSAGSYVLKINSRGLNSKIQVSVVDSPYTNIPFAISVAFSTAGNETSKAVTLPTASYTGTLEGGAFNIFDKLYLANEYLRNNSACPSAPPSEVSVCAAFTVAPKIRVFWKPGVDPGTTYLGLSYAISAYLRDTTPEMKGLYILGGKSGDSDCSDTDHFDNSVVLHEYGHFLEEAFAFSNSPGGSHDGNGVIDPRLAWSEGWANFFQAAVLGSPVYRDTNRNISCGSGTTLLANLTLDDKKNYQDVPYATNEGNYREVSISRTLYQAMTNSAASGTQANLGFPLIWRAFASTANGIASTVDRFRNSGLVNSHLYALTQASQPGKLSNLTSVFTTEKQDYNNSSYFYGQTVTDKSCAAYPFSMTGGNTYTVYAAAPGTPITGTAAVPSLQQNNGLYRFTWPGGVFGLTLGYKFPSSRPDLDLYLYKEDHVLFDLSTAVAYSARPAAQEGNNGTDFLEVIQPMSLAAGTYLIQVNMDSSASYSGISAQYALRLSTGGTLCP